MNRIFQILSVASIFYVVIRIILSIIFRYNVDTSMFLYYNITNDIFWYLIFYLFPIIISILFAIVLKRKKTLVNIGKIYIFVLVILTISGSIANKKYWGYYFKRPKVFTQIQNANELLSITPFEKEDSRYKKVEDTITLFRTDIVKDFYYVNYERPLYGMLSNGNSIGNLFDWKEIYKSSKTKINSIELRNIEDLLENSNYIDKPEKGYEKYITTKGLIIEFVTNKNRNTTLVSFNNSRNPRLNYDGKYFYVMVTSGQISNDHYGNYEFLIENNKIIKKNKYYFDVAGIEGMEYPIAAAFLELLILIITILLFFIIKYIKKLRTT